jgi:CheY-like chemotaxis protein
VRTPPLILIADDNPSNVDILKVRLEAHGYEILTAEDGEQALANATWTNTIGDPELITVWTDPDFDAMQRAFYYAHVIAIPTPRWTAYDAKFYNIDLPPEIPMITQERAYT